VALVRTDEVAPPAGARPAALNPPTPPPIPPAVVEHVPAPPPNPAPVSSSPPRAKVRPRTRHATERPSVPSDQSALTPVGSDVFLKVQRPPKP
jgi:hypothetical protein